MSLNTTQFYSTPSPRLLPGAVQNHELSIWNEDSVDMALLSVSSGENFWVSVTVQTRGWLTGCRDTTLDLAKPNTRRHPDYARLDVAVSI
jgi:hypothetical protein